MLKHRLVVSEMFYSIQGEGPSVGKPAVFLRLAACNLNCPGFTYQHPENQTHLGCDTKHVWQKGAPYSFDVLIKTWQEQDWITHLQQGAHLVITGGEPLLQQEALALWIELLDQTVQPYIEIETNGTLAPNDFLAARVNQFNVSPKLAHSGETKDAAYHTKALAKFSELPQSVFKFVIHAPEDVKEILNDYQKIFSIPSQKIWLMPEGGTLAQMQPKMDMVAELCKRYYFNFSPRLHIHIWDEATGV